MAIDLYTVAGLALIVAAVGMLWLRFMRQQCPSCRSWVDRNAIVCRRCGSEIA